MVPGIRRRDALKAAACGFGHLAFAGLAAAEASRGVSTRPGPGAGAPAGPHHPARAKRVIFLFMQGGVSSVDSFDYKPRLARDDGKQLPFDDARVIANTGARGSAQRVMKSPWAFRQHGQTGTWASELFPEMAARADELCFIRSMHTEGVAHGPATLFLHCGATTSVRPSMGSWLLYGLGSENENLPGFVSINPTAGNGGARNYGNAFLPATYQGTPLGRAGRPAARAAFRNIENPALSDSERRRGLDLIRSLNAEQARARTGDDEVEAVIASYDLAWRMQAEAPDILDLASEGRETLRLYGIDRPETEDFGRQCLMARRLCEAGVRFVQVTYGDNTANPAWDQHSNLIKHAAHARAVDRPIAGLLADLKARGLLDDTIVWWGSEFGRTPYAQNNGTGRDHNPDGFTVWLAGGGFKPGTSFGATDEFGHRAVVDRVHMHDLHATILHQLGIDHERLTYTYAGRPFRLTDVAGNVVTDVIA